MKKKFTEKKILILCGGRGKRLGNITKKIPKPLVKVGKKTIIEQKIKYYSQQGFKNYIFCIGYKGKILKKFIIKKCKKPIFSDGGIKSGILKRIYLAKKFINEPTIISYGDTLAKINFNDLLKKHKKSEKFPLPPFPCSLPCTPAAQDSNLAEGAVRSRGVGVAHAPPPPRPCLLP